MALKQGNSANLLLRFFVLCSLYLKVYIQIKLIHDIYYWLPSSRNGWWLYVRKREAYHATERDNDVMISQGQWNLRSSDLKIIRICRPIFKWKKLNSKERCCYFVMTYFKRISVKFVAGNLDHFQIWLDCLISYFWEEQCAGIIWNMSSLSYLKTLCQSVN